MLSISSLCTACQKVLWEFFDVHNPHNGMHLGPELIEIGSLEEVTENGSHCPSCQLIIQTLPLRQSKVFSIEYAGRGRVYYNILSLRNTNVEFGKFVVYIGGGGANIPRLMISHVSHELEAPFAFYDVLQAIAEDVSQPQPQYPPSLRTAPFQDESVL
jgi:hypothetical protein